MTDTFQPRNEIEHKMVAAQEGALDLEQFMEELMTAQLFLPVHEGAGSKIGNLQRSNKAKPLSLEAEDGTQVLVMFTSPDRARNFVKDYPGYEGGLLTDLGWVFENMGVGFGIALNPGLSVGLDIEPDIVAELARKHLH